MRAVYHVRERLDLAELRYDVLSHLTDAGAVARDPGGKGALQRNGEGIKADWGNREKGIVRKAFEDILPEEICWRKKSPYPKTHNPIYFNECVKRVRKILKKRSILNELLDRKGIEDIIENPDKITNPWYGQLMKAPQILAYIIELDYWFDKYNVEIV